LRMIKMHDLMVESKVKLFLELKFNVIANLDLYMILSIKIE